MSHASPLVQESGDPEIGSQDAQAVRLERLRQTVEVVFRIGTPRLRFLGGPLVSEAQLTFRTFNFGLSITEYPSHV